MAERGGGPTVRRRLLGARLRRLREGKGVTREAAGWAIRASESKISRMELGRVSYKQRDIADLLTLYDVIDDGERGALLTLASQASRPGWWHPYSDILPNWFQHYLDLEEAASLIRTYEIQFVPGLLQTDAYARAVISLGRGQARAEEIDRRVGLRMARKQLLTRANPPQYWAVIHEAVLRRPIGSPELMRSQIEALLRANALPNVRLQMIPFEAGGHAAASGAFTILRFAERDLPDIVYIEHLTNALYLDKREDVDHYAAAMGRLFIEAEPAIRANETLRAALGDF